IAGHRGSGLPRAVINAGACLIAMALAALLVSTQTVAQDKTPAPADQNGSPPILLAGFAECATGPAYLKLALDPSGGTGRLDFGPSIRSAFPRGAYRISAKA